MSTVPAEIAGIGSTTQKLRVSPGFDPLKAQVGPEEYFVLSRIDGKQTLKEVLLMTGLPIERAIAIVTKLRTIGALLLPNEAGTPAPASSPSDSRQAPRSSSSTPVSPMTPARGVNLGQRPQNPPPRASSSIPVQRPPEKPTPRSTPAVTTQRPSGAHPVVQPTPPRSTGAIPTMRGAAPARPPTAEPKAADFEPQIDTSLPDLTEAEQKALNEDCQLDAAERRRILALARLSDGRNPWALLGVPDGSEPKMLKRAYFKLSKEIHPDRYYGKRLGSFGPRMAVVFEAVSRAYARLTNPDKARASGAHPAVRDDQPQTQQEYAAEIFDRACTLEIGGDVEAAMKLFAAAVRIEPNTKFLRRAAQCALRANQPKIAVDYAKKAQSAAPNDPSAMRLLATAFRAVGKLSDAEEVLVMAMAMKSENDVLTSELRNDLAEVRRLLQAGS